MVGLGIVTDSDFTPPQPSLRPTDTLRESQGEGAGMTLAQLAEQFGLQRTDDPDFFREWQDNLPELSEREEEAIAEVKTEYLYLSQSDMLEPLVKMVVLSPLLKLAGFYRPPFRVTVEQKVELLTEDQGTLVRGLIDILVLYQQLWVVTIEAKRAEYSLKSAIPQILFYLLGQLKQQTLARPAYGLVTNGSEFRFLKLVLHPTPCYGLSEFLAIDNRGDLSSVLQILKRFAYLVPMQK